MRICTTYMLVAVAALLAMNTAEARIKKSDLNRKVVMTEEAALLSQVDTVSLYLSSERLAIAPRLTEKGVIEVEMTVLDPVLMGNRTRLHNYVSRLIGTFISVLEERLPIYAPAVAKNFNPDTDLKFIINEGAMRRPVASYSGGLWTWEEGQAIPLAAQEPMVPESDINRVRAMEPARKPCRCPARN
jgi:hypothetical protein